MGNRGMLSDEIVSKAKELLNIDITVTQLRLMPYIQYVMVNERRIDSNKVTEAEQVILSEWWTNGWIEGGESEMTITKEFWDAINQILWLGYVAYK